MKNTNSRSALIILLLIISASLMMVAQTYHITPVVTPATVIDGQAMAGCLTVDAVAISTSGEIAFVAACNIAQLQTPQMVITSRHIVAKDEDVIDGRRIRILSFYPIAINNHGQVAYTIVWVPDGKDPQDDNSWLLGICVDHHFVQQLPSNTSVTSLTLTDDGKVSYNQPSQSAPAASLSSQSKSSSASSGILGPIPIKLPPFRMPKNFPIGMPTIPQPPKAKPMPSASSASAVATALPKFESNNRGQVVIPASLPGGHFSILVVTPAN